MEQKGFPAFKKLFDVADRQIPGIQGGILRLKKSSADHSYHNFSTELKFHTKNARNGPAIANKSSWTSRFVSRGPANESMENHAI